MKRWLAIGLRMLAEHFDPSPARLIPIGAIKYPEGWRTIWEGRSEWLDTSTGTLYRDNGTRWEPVRDDDPLFAEPELDPSLRGRS